MALMQAVDDTLRTDRRHITVMAEVWNLFLWVLFTEITHLAIALVHQRLFLVLLRALHSSSSWRSPIWMHRAARLLLWLNLLLGHWLMSLPGKISMSRAVVVIMSHSRSLAGVALELAGNFKKLGCTFGIKHCCTLAELTDYCFKSVLILGCLLL